MIGWVLGVLGLLLFAFVLLSPLESLRWWADRGEREVRASFEPLDDLAPAVPQESRQYVVYLSGVGTMGGDSLSDRERAWLESVAEAVPDVAVVADVFPYSTENLGLLQRATKWLWRRLAKPSRTRRLVNLSWLINLRNITQVLVSADQRYGPTQSIGLAHEIWQSLQRHGYAPGSGTPVTLLGLSGGAQMALGAGWFLSGIGIPVSLISVGGIFGDDPGLDRVQRLWHLTGSKDHLHLLGNVAFPGRWPTAPLSPWGRAKREGRVTALQIGEMGHDGGNGYFGRRATGKDGRSHAETTRDAVAEILRGQG